MPSAKTAEVDTLRFADKDLDVVGTLEYGQYGVVSCFREVMFAFFSLSPQIDVVTCRLDGRVYVRKSTEKRFALRTHDVRSLSSLLATASNAPLAMLASI